MASTPALVKRTISGTLKQTLRHFHSRRPDPLNILSSTAPVILRAHSVSINLKRVETVAQVLALRPIPIPRWNDEYHFFDGSERTLMYLFVLDALNFSFWGQPKWTIKRIRRDLDGYWALAAALKRAAETQPDFLDADFLAAIDPEALRRVLHGNGEIPMFADRWRNVRELGRVLSERFGGSPARLVQQADKDAPLLAQLIAHHFSSFNDQAIYADKAVCFFKRAQILVADIWGSFGGEGWGEFRNLEQLTAFADYKLPQILRAWGILEYAPNLARRVDHKIALEKDSRAEIEIRAGMIWGVELLRDALARRGRVLTSVQMDWFLWESSHGSVKGIKPYHRVRTIYY